MKPVSEACERNRGPILEVLAFEFAQASRVLEIGSGTGQHAVWFGRHLPHLAWQPTEVPGNLAGVRAWLADEHLPNVLPPVELDVSAPAWPVGQVDAVFTANTLHIVSWRKVEAMFEGIGRHLEPGGRVAVYGPFNYGGRHTSASNRDFDRWLASRDAESAIRDFDAVDALARRIGLSLLRDEAMPANNRMLIWRRAGARGTCVPA